jgi:ATP-dependent RNA helicase RhlE
VKLLVHWGFAAAAIHGDKSQGQRERALAAFRAGEIRVLVATDVAARGLDIPLVRHVYNYDLPNVPDQYVHRIGRTARAGAAGRAVAFCAPAEMADLRAIETHLGEAIPVIGGTPHPEDAPPPKPAPRGARSGSGPKGGARPAKPARRPARPAHAAGAPGPAPASSPTRRRS